MRQRIDGEMKQLRSNVHRIPSQQQQECAQVRTFAQKFSNIDFFLIFLTLKDDELVMSEM